MLQYKGRTLKHIPFYFLNRYMLDALSCKAFSRFWAGAI